MEPEPRCSQLTQTSPVLGDATLCGAGTDTFLVQPGQVCNSLFFIVTKEIPAPSSENPTASTAMASALCHPRARLPGGEGRAEQ